MPTDSQDLKEHLVQVDPEFRDLATIHQELDTRLHELESKHYLSELEQVEETTIKKRKLHLKDRMEDIMRRHRSGPTEATPS